VEPGCYPNLVSQVPTGQISSFKYPAWLVVLGTAHPNCLWTPNLHFRAVFASFRNEDAPEEWNMGQRSGSMTCLDEYHDFFVAKGVRAPSTIKD